MSDFIETFRADEDGAVTVDWVVLIAAIVGLAIATMGVIFPETKNLASSVDDALGNVTIDSDI